MKKMFTLSVLTISLMIFFTGCYKEQFGVNENYWLSKERGVVVYSSPYCSYYVVETANGYTVLRAWGSYKPYENAVVYGNFSNAGTRDMYNYTTGYVFSAEVKDYWLSYANADYEISYYCH